MLRITGKVLDVTSETIQGPTGSFVSTTIHILDGVRVEGVRVARDFPPADLPRKDEEVELVVSVSAWAGKSGAGYRLTALSRVKSAGSRVAAVS